MSFTPPPLSADKGFHPPPLSAHEGPAASGGLDLGGIVKNIGGAIEGAGRNFGAARTAAARDPVGALGNVLGAPEGAVAGAVMAPQMEHTGNDLGKTLGAVGRGLVGGAVDPKQRDRYNTALGNTIFHGMRPAGNSIPARLGRGAEDFTLQTMVDPVTHGGAAAVGGLLKGGKAAASAVGKIPAVAKKVADAKDVLTDPKVAAAAGKVAHAIGKVNPVPGMVNAGKDMLFLNPLPHGLGNMTALNFLANGPGTTLKGLRYGITGAPKQTVADLQRMKAGAWTPSLLDEPSPWGPVGWMNALGKKGVPAAVRGGAGAAAGGAIGNKTAGDTATPQQRAQRIAEGALLGGITGASPEALNASNKVMSRLETGHRAAMLEDLPKVAAEAAKKPHFTAAQVAALGRRTKVPQTAGPATINSNAFAISPYKSGRIRTWPVTAEPKVDPRGDAINAVFGGLDKSPGAKIATALGGPFAGWQADVVPRNVGSALVKAPARVEAFARAQDITNRDILKDQPYKLQVGGPVGGAAELAFNTPKYASRLLGPLGAIDPNEATNPKTFSLGDKMKDAAYGAIPGRDVVGPFFGDTEYPNKAPAVPSATLNTLLGYYFKNKTPATDAILGIMQATGLKQQDAARFYERFKR